MVLSHSLFVVGTTQNSSRHSWRLVLLLTLLFSLVLNLFYSAAVVGSLLVPPPKTIRTLRQLIDSPLAVGIEDIGYNKDYLEVLSLVCCLWQWRNRTNEIFFYTRNRQIHWCVNFSERRSSHRHVGSRRTTTYWGASSSWGRRRSLSRARRWRCIRWSRSPSARRPSAPSARSCWFLTAWRKWRCPKDLRSESPSQTRESSPTAQFY